MLNAFYFVLSRTFIFKSTNKNKIQSQNDHRLILNDDLIEIGHLKLILIKQTVKKNFVKPY